MKSIAYILLITIILGCSSHRKSVEPEVPMIKLYDNVVIVIKSDNTLVQQQTNEKELQQSDSKDLLRVVHARLAEFTEDAVATQGDIKTVPECKPRTLKITEDIQSVIASNTVSLKRKLFTLRTVREQHDDFRVSITTTIEDCQSGKRLGKFTYENYGQDFFSVLKGLASWNVAETYKHQRGPQP